MPFVFDLHQTTQLSITENQTFLNLTFLKSRVPGAHPPELARKNLGPHGAPWAPPWGPIWAPGTLDLRNVRLRNVWFSSIDNAGALRSSVEHYGELWSTVEHCGALRQCSTVPELSGRSQTICFNMVPWPMGPKPYVLIWFL